MSNDSLICPICGEPTYIYFGNPRKDRLCQKHGSMLKNHWIEINKNGFYQTTEYYYSLSNGTSAIPEYEKSNNNKDSNEHNSNEQTCPICGEPTRVYMGNARKDKLCGKHADMLKAGELYLDSQNRFREKNTGNILAKIPKTKK